MRKFCLCSLVLTSAALSAGEDWCLERVLTLQADYGYIRRQDVRDLRLVEDTSILIDKNGELEPKKVMDTDKLIEKFDWERAFRGLAAIEFNPCFSIEAQYTYFHPWTGKKQVTGGASLQFPFLNPSLTTDYTGAYRVDAKYRSQLRNAEINFWYHMTPLRVNYFSFSWIFGARGLDLQEKMDLLFYQGIDQSYYKIETKDRLYGPQLGAMLQMNPTCHWTWTFILKGAGFFNRVTNDVCVRDQNNTVKIIDYKKKRLTSSCLFEAYGQLAFNIASFLSIHVGYQGFLLAGVGLAPDNRTVYLPQRPSLSDKGQILLDGAYAGIELSF